jgi:hypothetical protein
MVSVEGKLEQIKTNQGNDNPYKDILDLKSDIYQRTLRD